MCIRFVLNVLLVKLLAEHHDFYYIYAVYTYSAGAVAI